MNTHIPVVHRRRRRCRRRLVDLRPHRACRPPACGAVSAEEAAAGRHLDDRGDEHRRRRRAGDDHRIRSFTCPHCRDFHETVWAQLKQNYIDTGKVQFIYREVYFDHFGLLGRDGRALRRRDALFRHRRHDLRQAERLAGSPAATRRHRRQPAQDRPQAPGLTTTALDACLNDADMAKALVALYQKNATADDVKGTPTFFINGDASIPTCPTTSSPRSSTPNSPRDDGPARRPEGRRTGADSRGPLVRADAGRSRRRGDQGRKPRGRRYPPLGPAVHRPRRRPVGRLFPWLQPRQAVGRLPISARPRGGRWCARWSPRPIS